MRYEYIEPFVLSTIKVLNYVLPAGVTKGNHRLVKGGNLEADLAILIRIGGDSEGGIILQMDNSTALKLCNLMNETDFQSLPPLGRDSISELGNMIAGNATSVLMDLGYAFKVAPPLVLTRDDSLNEIPLWESFQIPLFTECGEITMNIALRTD